MRWFVEISSLGAKAGSSSVLCIEAPQWRHALQKARALRGDDGPLSNFSIDLLDDGYRAVDPASRLRYEVKRAPDDAPLSAGNSTPAPPVVAPKAEPPKAEPPKAEPPKEEPAPRALARTMAYASPGAVAVKEPEPAPRALAQTMAYASTGAAVVKEAPAAQEPAKEAPKEAPPVAKAPPPQAPVALHEPPKEALPSFVLVGSREENPTEASPLIYREMVFAVGPGTAEDDARHLILERFAHTKATLDAARAGKLINLAVFDHVFHGKPQRRPLVTLTWKDWKGEEPELRFPAREGEAPRAPTPSNAPASMPRPPATPAPAKVEPPKSEPAKPAPKVEAAPKPEPVKATPKPEPVKVEPTKPKVEPAKVEPARAEPIKAAVTPVGSTLSSAKSAKEPKPEPKAEVSVVEAKPARAEPVKAVKAEPAKVESKKAEPVKNEPAKAEPKAAPPKASEKAPLSAPASSAAETKPAPTVVSAKDEEEELSLDGAVVEPASRPKSTPPPVPKAAAKPAAAVAVKPAAPKKRLSGEDLITELFEACGDLHFLRDALEGAEFVLTLTMEKLPSEVALISFFDLGKREFMVARQAGGPRTALAMRQPERAALASQAMRRQHAIVASGDELSRAADERFRAVGVELRSLLVAPVALGGRYLGLIEIANPLDGGAFTEGDGNALTYIGQQFGEFLAAHGVILDRELILAPKAAAPEPVKAAPVKAAAEPAKPFFDGSGLKPRGSARPPKPDTSKRR